MPLYDYRCAQCEHVVELLRKPEDKTAECAQCGGEMGRQLSKPGGFTGLPTPKHSAPPRTYDPGFQREYDSIWNDEP